MGKHVTLPSGLVVDFEALPSSLNGLSGKFDPITGAPLDETALSHFDEESKKAFAPGVEAVAAQMGEKKKPA